MNSIFRYVCLSVLSCFSASLAEAAERSVSQPPNIIFFLVDDYDKPETSVYGGKVLTPNLDRLAAEGMTFTNAHVTSTVCTPSRYTCLTGRYAGASTSHVYLHECPPGKQGLPAFNVALEPDNRNVGQVLRDNGYTTGFVGKYHVGPHIDEHNAADYNWRWLAKNIEYSQKADRSQKHNHERARELIGERGFSDVNNIYWANMKAPFKGHNPEWTIEAALKFIDEHKNAHFYLHYSTTLLHGPNMEWFRSLSKPLVTDAGMLDKPLGLMDRDSVMRRIRDVGLTENEAGYLWMDDTLGLLLDRLDRHGIADNTIVLFLADHGSVNKGSLLKNRGTEVPCLMRWPARIKPGVQCDELIQNTDFVPTWFAAANVTPPKDYRIDGISMLPLFEAPHTPIRQYVYGEMGPARSVKTKDWNYIALRYTADQIPSIEAEHRSVKRLMGLNGGVSRARLQPDAFDSDQLYDLPADPEERKNVASKRKNSDQLSEMKRFLMQELTKFDRPFGEFVPGGDAVPASKQTHLAPLLKKFATNMK